jgi:hypothetical protein
MRGGRSAALILFYYFFLSCGIFQLNIAAFLYHSEAALLSPSTLNSNFFFNFFFLVLIAEGFSDSVEGFSDSAGTYVLAPEALLSLRLSQ